jgi:hypothetical protein
LGQRSRKRRATGGTAATNPTRRNLHSDDGVGRAPAGGDSVAGGEPDAQVGDLERGYARARAKDAEARASLEPLAPGERPAAVTVGAVVAGLIAVANVVLVAAGTSVAGSRNVAGGLVFAALMALAAVFMWRGKYWAVLGFQALLGLSVITASLSLLVASNVEAVVRSLIVIAAAGTLFWFLIRAMARLQMPSRTR